MSVKKLMLDAMDIYPTSEEIKDLTVEDLLYLYDRMDSYDDVVVPAMIALADMEDQYEALEDPAMIDSFMDDVYTTLMSL